MAFWTLAAAAVFVPLAFHPMKMQDLWWHLAAGRLMIERGELVDHDPWSFSLPGASWLNHEWLSDLLYAFWARGFGVDSLLIWQLAVVTLTYVLLFELLRRWTRSPGAALLGALGALLLARTFVEIRPHLYTQLGLVLTLWWAWLARRPLIVLPILFAVWANLHSGVVLGLGFLGLQLLARVHAGPEASGLTWRSASVLWSACALATLLTPHGFGGWAYPFAYAFGHSPFRGLREWLSPFSKLGLIVPFYRPALAAFAVFASLGFVSGRLRRPEPLGWPALAWGLVATAMSLVSSRFVPYFGLALAMVAAPALAGAERRMRLREPVVGWVLPLVILAGGAIACLRLPWTSGFDLLTTLELLPVDTCAFIDANNLQGRTFNYYPWGGYLIWRHAGRMRPYIDGRADTVYDAATWIRYSAFHDQRPGWTSIPEQVGADFVLWPTLPSPELPVLTHVPALLETGRWRPLYEDFGSVLLVRSDVALGELRPPPPSPYRSLALGAAAMRKGDLGEAERWLTAALDSDPGLLAACRNLALVQARRGHEAMAWRTHDQCQRLLPEPGAAAAISRRLKR